MTTRRRVEFYLHPAFRGSRWAPVYRYWPILAQTPLCGINDANPRQLGPGHNIYPCLEGVAAVMGRDYLKVHTEGSMGREM